MKLYGLDFLTTSYCVTTTFSNADVDDLYTILSTTSTTLGLFTNKHLEIKITDNYLSSIPTKELIESYEIVEERLNNIDLVMEDSIETPKVYKKV